LACNWVFRKPTLSWFLKTVAEWKKLPATRLLWAPISVSLPARSAAAPRPAPISKWKLKSILIQKVKDSLPDCPSKVAPSSLIKKRTEIFTTATSPVKKFFTKTSRLLLSSRSCKKPYASSPKTDKEIPSGFIFPTLNSGFYLKVRFQTSRKRAAGWRQIDSSTSRLYTG